MGILFTRIRGSVWSIELTNTWYQIFIPGATSQQQNLMSAVNLNIMFGYFIFHIYQVITLLDIHIQICYYSAFFLSDRVLVGEDLTGLEQSLHIISKKSLEFLEWSIFNFQLYSPGMIAHLIFKLLAIRNALFVVICQLACNHIIQTLCGEKYISTKFRSLNFFVASPVSGIVL